MIYIYIWEMKGEEEWGRRISKCTSKYTNERMRKTKTGETHSGAAVPVVATSSREQNFHGYKYWQTGQPSET
jgi:alkaline phosphatase